MKYRSLLEQVTIGIALVNLVPEYEDVEACTPQIIRSGINNRMIIKKDLEAMIESIASTGGLICDDPAYAVLLEVDASTLLNIEAIKAHLTRPGSILTADWIVGARETIAKLLNGSHRTEMLRRKNEVILKKRGVVARALTALTLLKESEAMDDAQRKVYDDQVEAMGVIHENLKDDLLFPAKLIDKGDLNFRVKFIQPKLTQIFFL